MSASTVLQQLGYVPIARFMRESWQRRPHLIRGALPDFRPPVNRDRLLELAQSESAESRLVTRHHGRWSVQHGPLERLPSLRRPSWTVLVQGVDLLDDAAHALLAQFRFVPDARLDDLMVSFATDGGGVGPHVDSYDVFLLQAAGRRRWRISRQRDLALVPDAPLKILADFRPQREFVLEPGDMLYLPPGVAHEGIALGECLTYSIGFRAPTYQELLEPWYADYADGASLPGRYTDPGLGASRQPAELPASMVARVHAHLMGRRPSTSDTRRFLLRYLTEPKAQTVYDRPARPRAMNEFVQLAEQRGVFLDRRTRMMYRGRELAINGEVIAAPADARTLLRTLADRRQATAAEVRHLAASGRTLLHQWHRAGWLHVAAAPTRGHP